MSCTDEIFGKGNASDTRPASWLCERQVDGERGAFAGRAGALDAPAVLPGDPLADGQAKTGAAGGAGVAAAVEPVEHVRQVLGRDAQAGVPDGDQHLVA